MPAPGHIQLQVLIVTHQPAGAARVAAMNLPCVAGVEYLVSWQNHGDAPLPPELNRDDVTVHRFDRPGVSANRNNLLRLASAPFVLVGDDDLQYSAEGLAAVLRCMESHPETDYFSFRYTGADRKGYPDAECNLARLPRNFYQTAFEVGLNRRGRAAALQFSDYFGPGAPRFAASEDEMLLACARHQGLSCRFFPLTVAEHPGLTTGSRPTATRGILASKGAMIGLCYPWSSPARVVLASWRESRRGRMAFLPALRAIASGARYALFHRNKLFNSGKNES